MPLDLDDALARAGEVGEAEPLRDDAVEPRRLDSLEPVCRGVATATLGLLTEWAFTELDMLRLELLITATNGPSKRVAERNGYRREGVLRSLYVKEGVRDDVEMWSRLASD